MARQNIELMTVAQARGPTIVTLLQANHMPKPQAIDENRRVRANLVADRYVHLPRFCEIIHLYALHVKKRNHRDAEVCISKPLTFPQPLADRIKTVVCKLTTIFDVSGSTPPIPSPSPFKPFSSPIRTLFTHFGRSWAPSSRPS